jgi:hypothetical protein
MIEATLRLYGSSKTQKIRMEKVVHLQALPRPGDRMEFLSSEKCTDFRSIKEVIFNENGTVVIWLDDDKEAETGLPLLFDEGELSDFKLSMPALGWQIMSSKEHNTQKA